MNAIELLKKDHRNVEELFASFEGASEDDRAPIVADIVKELSIHAAIEEAYLYPVIRQEVEGGVEMVEESLEEHQGAKEILAKLDGKVDRAHTKEVASLVSKLQGEIEHHVQEEEGEVFPALERSVTRTRLAELGAQLGEAKSSAPTRPHPNQPPATTLTGKANAVVDRMRDAVSKR